MVGNPVNRIRFLRSTSLGPVSALRMELRQIIAAREQLPGVASHVDAVIRRITNDLSIECTQSFFPKYHRVYFSGDCELARNQLFNEHYARLCIELRALRSIVIDGILPAMASPMWQNGEPAIAAAAIRDLDMLAARNLTADIIGLVHGRIAQLRRDLEIVRLRDGNSGACRPWMGVSYVPEQEASSGTTYATDWTTFLKVAGAAGFYMLILGSCVYVGISGR